MAGWQRPRPRRAGGQTRMATPQRERGTPYRGCSAGFGVRDQVVGHPVVQRNERHSLRLARSGRLRRRVSRDDRLRVAVAEHHQGKLGRLDDQHWRCGRRAGSGGGGGVAVADGMIGNAKCKTQRADLPSSVAAWRFSSSNTSHFPSVHRRVTSLTVIAASAETLIPTCRPPCPDVAGAKRPRRA